MNDDQRTAILAMNTMLSRWLRFTLLIPCSVLFLTGELAAEEPPSSVLWNLVPNDAAVVLEALEPERQLEEFLASPLAERFQQFPLWQRFRDGPIFQHGVSIDQQVLKQTGASVTQHVRDCFARGVMVAVEFPVEGKPQAVIMGMGNSPQAASRFLESWAKVDKKWKTRKNEHAGITYLERYVPGNPSQPGLFVVHHQAVWAFSDKESMIRAVIDRQMARTAESELRTRHPRLLELRDNLERESLDDTATAPSPSPSAMRLLMDARRLEPWLKRQPNGDEKFLKVFGHLGACGVKVIQRERLQVVTRVQFEPGSMPAAWGTFCELNRGSLGELGAVSNDAVAVIRGQSNFRPFSEPLWSLISAEKPDDVRRLRRVLRGLMGDRDPLDDWLPQSLQEWRLTVLAGKLGSESTLPLEFVADVPLVDGPPNNAPQANTAPHHTGRLPLRVLNSLEFGMQLWAADWNARHETSPLVTLQSETNSGEELRWLQGAPFGHPAISLRENRLRVASDRKFLSKSAVDSESRSHLSARTAAPWARGHAAIDAVRLRSWMAENQSDLERRGWRASDQTPLREVLKLVDLVDLDWGFAPSAVQFSLATTAKKSGE